MNPLMKFLVLVASALIALGGTALFCRLLIFYHRKQAINQGERLYLNHHQKVGTPSLGGIAIILGLLIPSLIFTTFDRTTGAILLILICFFLVGLVDDLVKIGKKSSAGIPGWLRLGGEALAVIIALRLLGFSYSGLWYLQLPLVNYAWYLGFFFIFFALVFIVGMANASNLTDGLDGLNAGLILIAFTPIFLLSLREEFNIAIIIASTIGALLGFLRYNFHPARLFMGDCGSLPLGALLATCSVVMKLEVTTLLAAGWLILEALSVMLQVAFYQLTGKRIFLMAPLHHHFEKKGWPEWRVIMFFWLIGFVLVIVSLVVAG